MRVTYRPIENYPKERTQFPQRSRFDSTWETTLFDLDRELRHLGADEVVFQLDMEERDIRMDGMPRMNARPRSQAVVISFESDKGPLQFATDTFSDWKQNVRAIALGLESLRRVDRYGITQNSEQYTGWKQLGSGIPMGEAKMSKDEAAKFIAAAAGDAGWATDILDDLDFAKVIWRDAARNLHPDRSGSSDEYLKLDEAWRILKGER